MSASLEKGTVAGETSVAGRTIGKYRLVRPLGRGGMGVVHLAEDPTLHRRVALKLLPPELARRPETVARFLREAQAAARLNHPHVVTVHESGRDGDICYLAMEFIDGGSAQDAIRMGPLPWREATQLVADACRGLAAAHAAGVLHRDVKPGNILRTREGIAKLADFGLARLVGSESGLTRDGQMIGTPEYMSPEQWDREPAEDFSDIYALGATYYTLLVGRPPYTAELPLQIGFAHQSAPIPDPRTAIPHLPEACTAIIRRALAKRPAERYGSATALLLDLDGLLQGTLPSPFTPPPLEVACAPTQILESNRAGRRRLVAALGVGTLLTLGSGGIVFSLVARDPGDDARKHRSTPASSPPLSIPEEGLTIPTGGLVEGIAFSPDGQTLAATVFTEKGGVVICDLKSGSIQEHCRGILMRGVAFSPDGELLACGPVDGNRSQLVRCATREVTAGPTVGGMPIRALAFSPDGRTLAVGLASHDSLTPHLIVWDFPEFHDRKWPSRHRGGVWTIQFTADGKSLISTAGDGKVLIWDVNAPEHPKEISVAMKQISPAAALAPDGKTLAVAAGGQVAFYPWGTWAPTGVTLVPGVGRQEIWSLAYARGGERIISVDWAIRLADPRDGRFLKELERGRTGVRSVAVSPDGNLAAWSSGDSGNHHVRVVDLRQLERLP